MDDIKPPLAGAAPQSRAAKPIAGGAGLAGIAAMAAALAVAGIKPDEGKVNRTYLDVAKIPTYCFGHADRASRVGTAHTDAQCEAVLRADVQLEQDGVAACVPALRSRPYQWAASTRLAHNIGVTAFCRSGAAIHFNRGDWRGGCDLFLPWDKLMGNRGKVGTRRHGWAPIRCKALFLLCSHVAQPCLRQDAVAVRSGRQAVAEETPMIRTLMLAAVAVAMTASPAISAPCRDAKGHFAKCPTAAAKPMRCKNAKGQFARCGTAGAKPM